MKNKLVMFASALTFISAINCANAANIVAIENETNLGALVTLTVNNWIDQFQIAANAKYQKPTPMNKVLYAINFISGSEKIDAKNCNAWINFNESGMKVLKITSRKNPEDKNRVITCEVR